MRLVGKLSFFHHRSPSQESYDAATEASRRGWGLRSIEEIRDRKFFINRKTMKRSFASLARGLRNTRLNSFPFRSCQTTRIWFYGHRKTVKWGVCCGGSQRRIRFVCRYVERNPLRANLLTKAEAWRYGSLLSMESANRATSENPLLSPWPIPRLPNWNQHVNEPISEKELSALRTCVNRGRP